ncbi:MAG: Fic family protein [Candidatus Micrarchaeota archaeon]
MHVEVRKGKGGRKFYLAHSYRKGGKVRKLRVYLGANLSREELLQREKEIKAKLFERINASRFIHDPFKTVVSKEELAELKSLEAGIALKITHLSEEDWQKFTEAFTYNTNAIEGSSLEEREVSGILEKDKWPNKPKEDISETYGVAKAVDYIRKTKEHVSLELILALHRIVFENSKSYAGTVRPRGVEVVVSDQFGNIIHRGAPSTQVKSLLEELVVWYGKNKKKYPPLVLAAVVHNQFENIHPFQDGNGRVGRLLLNNILLKHNLPPLNIEYKHRHEYYASLQAYEREYNLRSTIELMLKEYRELKKLLKKRGLRKATL